MLIVLRIVFGFALMSVFVKAVDLAGPNPQTEGTTDAGYVVVAVAIGFLNAIVWAPFFGRLLADPLTGAFTTGNPGDMRNSLLQFAHKLALRRHRRWAVFFAFLEGVRHPDLPGAFVVGINNTRPGSWLQSVFAREVWRFDNAENCLRAWKILSDRGSTPDLHRRPEVHLLIQSQQRVVPPPALPLVVPVSPRPAAPKRNERIELFSGSPAIPAPPPVSDEPPAVPEVSGASVGGESGTGLIQEPNDTQQPTLSQQSTEPPALGMRERLRILFTGRTGG